MIKLRPLSAQSSSFRRARILARQVTFRQRRYPLYAFTTTDMSDDVAYSLTKAYWENKKSLGAAAKWWDGVNLEMLSNILTEIHPGAKRYYKEVGAMLADHH